MWSVKQSGRAQYRLLCILTPMKHSNTEVRHDCNDMHVRLTSKWCVVLFQQDVLLEAVDDAGFDVALAAKQPEGELRLARVRVSGVAWILVIWNLSWCRISNIDKLPGTYKSHIALTGKTRKDSRQIVWLTAFLTSSMHAPAWRLLHGNAKHLGLCFLQWPCSHGCCLIFHAMHMLSGEMAAALVGWSHATATKTTTCMIVTLLVPCSHRWKA
jgi:hypothetical protein